jgi:choline transport protein
LPEKLLFRNAGWAPVAIRLESRDIIAPYTTVECDRWILLTIHQMMVTFCFAIQSVEEQVIMSTSPYPFVDIFATATGSTAAAIGMTVPMVLMTLSMCINSTAAASRQAWSFARDDGLPFPRWFTRLVPINSTPLPINAMIMSLVILIVVALLNFGGSEVFNSIIGLMTGAVGLTYALSIGCVLWRRLYGDPLPPARWSLGRWGVPINIIALLYEVFSTVISFFPLFAKVDAKMMNWGTISFPFTRLGVSA